STGADLSVSPADVSDLTAVTEPGQAEGGLGVTLAALIGRANLTAVDAARGVGGFVGADEPDVEPAQSRATAAVEEPATPSVRLMVGAAEALCGWSDGVGEANAPPGKELPPEPPRSDRAIPISAPTTEEIPPAESAAADADQPNEEQAALERSHLDSLWKVLRILAPWAASLVAGTSAAAWVHRHPVNRVRRPLLRKC